jgi:hypothetical protein
MSDVTLMEFLLARIAWDQRAVDAYDRAEENTSERMDDQTRRWVRRLDDECEAKRRILELHRPNDLYNDGVHVICEECGDLDASPAPHPCYTLKWLALPYADHPDFQAEWRVEVDT